MSGDIRETAGAELVAKASFHIVHHGFFGCACSMFIFKLLNVDSLYLRIDISRHDISLQNYLPLPGRRSVA